jgi:hypothetical protein
MTAPKDGFATFRKGQAFFAVFHDLRGRLLP